ncbi:MAG: 4Fe-4S dicluster domain-containing protein [Anaerolineales bacterium]|nr:4Fe-4S dicluster domain-containing protein [Anaerolineales bacterium]
MQESSTQVKYKYVVMLNDSFCDGCRQCLPSCTFGAMIWVRSDETLLIDSWACTGCGTCVTACPGHALKLRPRSY